MDEKMSLKSMTRTIFALISKKQAKTFGFVIGIPACPSLYKPENPEIFL